MPLRLGCRRFALHGIHQNRGHDVTRGPVQVALSRLTEHRERRFASQTLAKRSLVCPAFRRIELVALHRPVLGILLLRGHDVMDPSASAAYQEFSAIHNHAALSLSGYHEPVISLIGTLPEITPVLPCHRDRVLLFVGRSMAGRPCVPTGGRPLIRRV